MGQHKGYKQTPDHIAKRKRFGDAHHAWLGDHATEKTGRSRALRKYPGSYDCESCGKPNAERHHKDDNTLNNTEGNIEFLCRRCHMEKDGRLADFIKVANKRLPGMIEKAARKRRARTLCKRGHPLSGDNLYINKKGGRVCKECRKLHKKVYHTRRTNAA